MSMQAERQTERLYREIDGLLKWTGLYRAAKGTPSLLVTMFASVVVMECLLIPAPIQIRAVALPGLLILGIAIGLISVASGDFWDRKVFDPRYGLQGTWLDGCPWALFPSGSDLKHYRNLAIQKLKPNVINPETGEGVYRVSKKIVQSSPARWDWVEEPNLLSKFARNFILPLFAAMFLFLAVFAWHVTDGNYGTAMFNLAIAAACFVMAVLLFIPYLNLRIEHMIRLYSEVIAREEPKVSTTNTSVHKS